MHLLPRDSGLRQRASALGLAQYCRGQNAWADPQALPLTSLPSGVLIKNISHGYYLDEMT